MLDPTEDQRTNNDDCQELSPSDGFFHDEQYPFIKEFSELLATVSTNVLKFTLMTFQQRLLAKALWEAQNYGGSESKCIAHLKEIYGSQWRSVTTIKDHMEPERVYCEYVLILDHQQQWNKTKKQAKIPVSTKAVEFDGNADS